MEVSSSRMRSRHGCKASSRSLREACSHWVSVSRRDVCALAPTAAAKPARMKSRRHSAAVRVTHWITAISFVGLLVSGIAILIAHPRLYWGETGALGGPSLIDLPIPFMIGHSGWGRYLHFLSAWVCVLTGLFYVLSGFWTRHFRRELMPSKADLSWRSIARVVSDHVRLKRRTDEQSRAYNVLQRLSYAAVVFLL